MVGQTKRFQASHRREPQYAVFSFHHSRYKIRTRKDILVYQHMLKNSSLVYIQSFFRSYIEYIPQLTECMYPACNHFRSQPLELLGIIGQAEKSHTRTNPQFIARHFNQCKHSLQVLITAFYHVMLQAYAIKTLY